MANDKPISQINTDPLLEAAAEYERIAHKQRLEEGLILDCGNGVEMKLNLIPAGSFIMGGDGDSDEKPKHRVEITKPFYMGIYPVTQAQYEAVIGENPSEFKGRDNPMECVTWNDMNKFCGKLSLNQKVRLPTEAEWEYACRAGTTCENYGNIDDIAWHKDNSGETTHPVGLKQPNAFGLHDMIGNIWEWCEDWYNEDYYKNSPTKDPKGPSTGSFGILRGGSWYNDGRGCRSAARNCVNPGFRWDISGGARVVVNVSQEALKDIIKTMIHRLEPQLKALKHLESYSNKKTVLQLSDSYSELRDEAQNTIFDNAQYEKTRNSIKEFAGRLRDASELTPNQDDEPRGWALVVRIIGYIPVLLLVNFLMSISFSIYLYPIISWKTIFWSITTIHILYAIYLLYKKIMSK